MLSIIICTYNRSNILDICLETIAQYYPKEYNVEVVVVDNNSNDSTPKMLGKLTTKYPWIIKTTETKQGLSYARNRGYKVASNPWVLYLDDDAKIDVNLFNRAHELISKSVYSCIGGLYIPWYRHEKPKWYRDQWASNDIGYTDIQPLKKHAFASGGIFLVQKKLLEKYNGFDPEYGMLGKQLGYGEETDFQRRIRNAGNVIAFDPKLIVYHLVPPHKMRVKWILLSAFKMGKTYLESVGYPHNRITGLLSLFVGVSQFLTNSIFYLPLLLTPKYYVQNYSVDIARKPAKWIGAFIGTWSK